MPSPASRSLRPGRSKVSFTTRGSSVLAAAIAAGAGSLALGETDLLRVAIIIALVCLATWLLSSFAPVRLRAEHTALPPEAPIGEAMTIRVSTRIRRALMPSTIVCHDRTSDGLRPTGHLAVVSSRAQSGISLAFITSPRERGAHTVGPLEVTMRDPFGLVTTKRAGTDQITVLGLPRWYDVHPAWLRTTGPVPRFLDSPTDRGVEGEPDVGVREHRAEDGLRRIHWRTSARAGRLMTRLDEPQADRTATIGFESRSRLHRGSTFELTLEVVASLGLALLAQGWDLRIVDSAGERTAPGAAWDAGSLLRFLALADRTSDGSAPVLAGSDGPSLLVTTEPPEPAAPLTSRVIVVEPHGQQRQRHAAVTYVGGGQSIADALAVAPQSGALA